MDNEELEQKLADLQSEVDDAKADAKTAKLRATRLGEILKSWAEDSGGDKGSALAAELEEEGF